MNTLNLLVMWLKWDLNQFEIMSSSIEIWQKNLTLVKCDKSFFKRFACYESLKIGRFSAKILLEKKIPSQLWLHSFWNIFRDLNVVLRILTHVKSPSLHSSRKKVEKFFSRLFRKKSVTWLFKKSQSIEHIT